MASILETREDLEWLRDVHKIPIDGVAAAIIHGQEDCPNRIETYAQNDYQCAPAVYVFQPSTFTYAKQ